VAHERAKAGGQQSYLTHVSAALMLRTRVHPGAKLRLVELVWLEGYGLETVAGSPTLALSLPASNGGQSRSKR
jgi:hypothetical protein